MTDLNFSNTSSIAETAEKIATTENFVRNQIKQYALHVKAQLPNPLGLPSVRLIDPESGQERTRVPNEAIEAYLERRAARKSGASAKSADGTPAKPSDGRKVMKVRISEAELAAMHNGELGAEAQKAIAASAKSGNNYDPAKSKAYRISKAKKAREQVTTAAKATAAAMNENLWGEPAN